MPISGTWSSSLLERHALSARAGSTDAFLPVPGSADPAASSATPAIVVLEIDAADLAFQQPGRADAIAVRAARTLHPRERRADGGKSLLVYPHPEIIKKLKRGCIGLRQDRLRDQRGGDLGLARFRYDGPPRQRRFRPMAELRHPSMLDLPKCQVALLADRNAP